MPMYFPLVSDASRPYYDVSVVPAGGERGVTGRALALAESGEVNLPTPQIVKNFTFGTGEGAAPAAGGGDEARVG
jgi:hypothetical protein